MDKSHFKKEILTAGILKHQAVIEDFRTRIREMMIADKNINEEEYDAHGLSHKAETVAEVSLLTDQLQFANHELDELRKIESFTERIHPAVEFGTVVTTDKDTFFVAAAMEPFSVDGRPISGLPVHSLLYKKMKGKREGETFSDGSTNYCIKEIF